MTSNKRVLIVILNYKTFELTVELITRLNSLDRSIFDVFVIDNCSPNDSAAVLRELSKENDFIFYENNINAGYAAGNNIGIRYAISHAYDYSLILNNDIKIVDDDFIEKLVGIADNNKKIACVGPKIIDLNGNVVSPYCDQPSLYSMTFGIFNEKKKRAKSNESPRIVYRVFGCCMLLKNSYMELVDCFDERTFLYEEEDILAERLLKHDAFSYYYPLTSIVHMESSTVNLEKKAISFRKMKTVRDSMYIYLRHYRQFNRFEIWLCQSVRCLILLFRR